MNWTHNIHNMFFLWVWCRTFMIFIILVWIFYDLRFWCGNFMTFYDVGVNSLTCLWFWSGNIFDLWLWHGNLMILWLMWTFYDYYFDVDFFLVFYTLWCGNLMKFEEEFDYFYGLLLMWKFLDFLWLFIESFMIYNFRMRILRLH